MILDFFSPITKILHSPISSPWPVACPSQLSREASVKTTWRKSRLWSVARVLLGSGALWREDADVSLGVLPVGKIAAPPPPPFDVLVTVMEQPLLKIGSVRRDSITFEGGQTMVNNGCCNLQKLLPLTAEKRCVDSTVHIIIFQLHLPTLFCQ